MNSDFAYLLGVLHDAHIICRKEKGIYGFELEQKNKVYISYLIEVIDNLFGIKPRLETRNRTWGKYYRIRVHSKKVYLNLIKYDFKDLLRKSPRNIKKSLIRGLFDAEGSVSSNEVRIFNKDIGLLIATKEAIESFGVRCGRIVICCGDVLQVPIYSKEHKNKFIKIFKPKHPNKIVSF